jgi:hypothetical protein
MLNNSAARRQGGEAAAGHEACAQLMRMMSLVDSEDIVGLPPLSQICPMGSVGQGIGDALTPL